MGLPAEGRGLTLSATAGLLVVCAVPAERDAVLAGLPGARVVVAGIGPAAAAAATATALATGPRPTAVVNAGIAGGFGVALGTVVVASRLVAADLGVATTEGLLMLDAFGDTVIWTPPPAVVAEVARRADARAGTVLTLSTATGTDSRARDLVTLHDPIAEAMEGTGVATATAAAGVPMLEVRTISNAVGRRDLSRWDLPGALAALTAACAAALTEELPWP